MILWQSLRARIYPSLPFILLFTVIRNYKKLAFLARARVLCRESIFDHHSTRKKSRRSDHFRRMENGIFSGYAAARSRTKARKHWKL